MTGPEHYREAERLAALAEEHWTEPEGGYDDQEAPSTAELEIREFVRENARKDAMTWLALAQVHATLAAAAATAELDAYGMADGCATGRTEKRGRAWAEAIGGNR